MSASGVGAFLALWNGVNDPDRVGEYEAWHAFEHVPERVGSPGFAWADRYAAAAGVRGQPAYFTLYALADTSALLTDRYQELLDHPTDWSARMRGVLSDFRREPCALLSSHGIASAARLATLQVSVDQGEGEAPSAITQALAALVASGRALSACWGRVDARSGHPLSGAPALAPGGTGFDAVILLQHWRDDALAAAVRDLQAAITGHTRLRAPVARYEFQTRVRQEDLPHPLHARQPARPDLREHWLTGDPRP